MKIVMLIGDGMGDLAIPELGGQTPLQLAHTPTLDAIATAGELRQVSTTPNSLPPGSDVATLSLLGYNPEQCYHGRAPIEAAGANICLHPDDTVFRANLVHIDDGQMKDYTAGHISEDEAEKLISDLRCHLTHPEIQLHCGSSYRHIITWRNGPTDWDFTPPHEMCGQQVSLHKPHNLELYPLCQFMDQAAEFLSTHPINKQRNKRGDAPANALWPWGQGRAFSLESFHTRYGHSGGIVSAVPLLKGIASLTGLEAPHVEGATGWIDTDYAAKCNAAFELLSRNDFALVHIEAPDECGHIGDAKLKIKAIEAFDKYICAPVWDHLKQLNQPYLLILATDHRTPVKLRRHSADPVPMVALHSTHPCPESNSVCHFDEFTGATNKPCAAHSWIQDLLKNALFF